MRTSMKKVTRLFLPLGVVFGLVACETEEDGVPAESQSSARLQSTAESSQSSNSNERVIVGAFSATDFEVGTKDVEMKYAAKTDIAAGISLGNISLRSNVNSSLGASASEPKSLVLLSEGDTRLAAVGEGNTPEGKYTEVEFQLFKNTGLDSDHHMYEKTLLIRGEINDVPTWIWLDSESKLIAEVEESDGLDVEDDAEMLLVFDMDRLFANVDFEAAIDADSDGRIDIGPDNADGNAALHSTIENNLSSAVRFEKK